jgi:hypothetical protein
MKAVQKGISVKNPAGNGRWNDKMLGELIDDLRTAIPKLDPYFTYLEYSLSNQSGYNLRNDILHGIDLNITKEKASLILHCSLFSLYLLASDGI